MDSDDRLAMPRMRATPEEARTMPVSAGRASPVLLRHGSMELHWLELRTEDTQTPHDRDEVYIVVSGTGMFVRAEDRHPFADGGVLPLAGEERVPVKPGDALFVPAGTVHRFEATSPDFGAWMVFYGPEGGEVP